MSHSFYVHPRKQMHPIKMAAYLWRYVAINLFWFLDLLRLPLHRRVMLILLFSHRRPPLRSE